MHEKGRLFELKDLVIKVVGTVAIEGVKVDGFPRAKMHDPWKGVAMVINVVLLNNRHITSLFASALRILAAIKYGELVDFADFMRRIERNISLWQEGKEHEIIYPGLLQLLIGQAFSERKGKARVEDSLEDAAETLLQVAGGSQGGAHRKRKRGALAKKELFKPLKNCPRQRGTSKLQKRYKKLKMYSQRLKEKIQLQAAELKEKRIEMSLFWIVEVLRSQGLESPVSPSETGNEPGESSIPELQIGPSLAFNEQSRRVTPSISEKDQQVEMQALQIEREKDKAHFEEQLEQKEEVELLQERISTLEVELQMRGPANLEQSHIFQGLERGEAQMGKLEQKLQEQETKLN